VSAWEKSGARKKRNRSPPKGEKTQVRKWKIGSFREMMVRKGAGRVKKNSEEKNLGYVKKLRTPLNRKIIDLL